MKLFFFADKEWILRVSAILQQFIRNFILANCFCERYISEQDIDQEVTLLVTAAVIKKERDMI